MDTIGVTICIYVTSVILKGGGEIALIYLGNKAALMLFHQTSPLRRSFQRSAVYALSVVRTVGAIVLWGCVVLFLPIGPEWAGLVALMNALLVIGLRALRRRADRRVDAAIESYAIVPLEE